LSDGFARHGINAEIAYRADVEADLHISMGPWFAFERWRHKNMLYIDRAYWGDPHHVSVHWMVNGEKLFTMHNPPREHPETKPYKAGDRKIYLADYGDKWGSFLPDEAMTIRYHPSQSTPERTLVEDLANHDIAIGKRTTALVDAAIHGLTVHTKDPYSPVYRISGCTDEIERAQWLNDLAWHNWSLNEIKSGDMWHALGTTDESH
jgi:hypothetical protein